MITISRVLITSLKFPVVMAIVFSCFGCYDAVSPVPESDLYYVKPDQFEKLWEKDLLPEIDTRVAETYDTVFPRNLKTTSLPEGELQIRIWVGFDGSALRGVILDRSRSGKVDASYVPSLDKSSDYPGAVQSGIRDETWASIISSGLLSMNDSAEPINRKKTSVVIEIRNGTSYRNLRYADVNGISDRNHEWILNICSRLSSEVGIDLLNVASMGR